MSNRFRSLQPALLLALLALLLTAASLITSEASLDRWLIASSGGSLPGDAVIGITDSLGQPVTGASQADGVALQAGFWNEAVGPAYVYRFPVVFRPAE